MFEFFTGFVLGYGIWVIYLVFYKRKNNKK